MTGEKKKPSRGRTIGSRRAFSCPIRKLFFQRGFCTCGSHHITRVLSPDPNEKIPVILRPLPPPVQARPEGGKLPASPAQNGPLSPLYARARSAAQNFLHHWHFFQGFPQPVNGLVVPPPRRPVRHAVLGRNPRPTVLIPIPGKNQP